MKQINIKGTTKDGPAQCGPRGGSRSACVAGAILLAVSAWLISAPCAHAAGRLVADATNGDQAAVDGETYTSNDSNGTWYAVNGKTITSGSGNKVIQQTSGAYAVFADVGFINAHDLTVESQGYGVWATNGSLITLASSTITANGYGIASYSGATHVTGSNISITANDMGVLAKWGGSVTLADARITSASRDGVQIVTSGTVRLSNVTIDAAVAGIRSTGAGGGKFVEMENIAITTHAASGYGAQADDNTTMNARNIDIVTEGNSSRGFYSAKGSEINLSGTIKIVTNGYGASGLIARYAGADYAVDTRLFADASSVLDITINGGNALFHSSGVAAEYMSGDVNKSYVELAGYAKITLNNTAYGYGLYSSGSNTYVKSTGGGEITTHNKNGYGMHATSRGLVEATQFAINTDGANGYGVYASGGGVVRFASGIISTSGSAAHGMRAYGANSLFSGSALVVSTTGNFASGLDVSNKARAELSDADIATAGDHAAGLKALSSGTIQAARLNIATTGMRAVGIAADGATVELADTVVSTRGRRAHGAAFGDTAGALMTLDNVSISTEGELADGIFFASNTNALPQTLVVNGGSIVSAQSAGISVNRDEGGENAATPGRLPSADALAGRSGVYDITLNSTNVAGSTAALDITSIRTGTNTAGETVEIDMPTNVTVLATSSTLNGGVNLASSATTTLTLAASTRLAGDIDAGGSTHTTLSLDASAFAGSAIARDNAALHIALANGSSWRMTAPSRITTLASTNNAAGGITIAEAQGGDLTVTGGISGQTRLLVEGIAAASIGQQRIHVVVDETNTMDASAFALANEGGKVRAASGLHVYDYGLSNNTDGAWLQFESSEYSPGGAAVLNSASLGAVNWFTNLDALHKRMGEFRAGDLGTLATSGNIWVRTRGGRLNADNGVPGLAFSQYDYGVTAGADKAWGVANTGAVVLTGAFLDMGSLNRDFDGTSEGNSDVLGAGLYATWLHPHGWYADAVLRYDGNKHDFDTGSAAADAAMRADYDTDAAGLSLEFGRKLAKESGWWLEPSAQAAVAWLGGADYTTHSANAANILGVHLGSTRASQYRAQVRAGRDFDGGRWMPYAKMGIAYVDTNGGEIRSADQRMHCDYDGWRAEFGAGVAFAIDASSQVYFDYEYANADAYERPWTLSLGYRRGW